MSAAATATVIARVPTASGSRYLQQLCKHWSHRFPDTAFDATAGTVPFAADTRAIFAADTAGLDVRIEAPDAATAERMQGVVASHLDRFAFREAPLPFDWRAG